MYYIEKIIFFISFIFLSSPTQAKDIDRKIFFSSKSKQTINHGGHKDPSNKTIFGINFNSKSSGFETNINIKSFDANKFLLNESYIQKSSNNKTFGIGLIDRNWSFSTKTSLILSSNAQPFKSIYFKFHENDELSENWLSSIKNTTLEVLNGINKDPESPNNSQIFGIRLSFSPVENLEIEALRISQWGGDGYNNKPSAILKSLINDTNNGDHRNINQLAGFGLSYKLPKTVLPIRVYAQIAGEDEAGNLPSCLMYLGGADIQKLIFGKPSNIGLEMIDTTIDFTENGNCGPNTAYNNTIYKYANHGVSMGAPIDTEGKSIEFYGSTTLSSSLIAEISIKKLLINSDNFKEHRLSSTKKDGWLSSTGITWKNKNINILAELSYQSFSLEKIKSSNGISFSISSGINF